MLNTLLIHSNNTPLLSLVNSDIRFAPTIEELNNSDIDTYISNKIIPKINMEKFDIIYIRDTLSDNYIDFYGLILAYHIRLSSNILKKESLVPIVILSDIDSYTVNKITTLGNILFTKNIFISPNNQATVIKYNSIGLNYLSEEAYIGGFLNKIEIEAPKDYLSHHSITNEWAIDQWARILNVSSDKIIENRNKIDSLLYYKYLREKYHLEDKSENKITKTSNNGKVLLVDDKYNDGWEDILKEFVSKHYTDVDFKALHGINKESTLVQIDLLLTDEIDKFNPDLVILDLRLLNNENYNTKNEYSTLNINKISGVQLLKRIKEINPSIQIIMFTASSDSLILDTLYSKGILGYVKKDSPSNEYQASKNSFKKLDTLIKVGLNRKYLKEIYRTQDKILKLSLFKNVKLSLNKEENTILELKNNITFIFEILNSNMPKPFLYAMFTINKCLELIVDYYIEEKYIDNVKQAVWIDTNQPLNVYNTTENKILEVINVKFTYMNEVINKKIREIVCSRNYAIHGGEKKERCINYLISNPNEANIQSWFSMLSIILDRMDSVK